MNGKEEQFPKDYRENMAWRRNLLAKCAKDPLFRERTRELFFRDPLFAFNAFFFTYDPRKRPLHQQPFCTYPHQDEHILGLVDAINDGHDYLTEKSRDMGATWDVVGTFVWFWLNPSGGSDFLCGSRIEDYVDKKGDMRTLLEKARYIVYRLPGWLRPKGFRKNVHDNFMRLWNPETGASITGESNNPNFSTGGRYAGILFDEFAKWESSDESAWTAAGDASPCRIPVSTPFGAGGQYYVLATDGKTKKVTLHWTLHPEKRAGLYCVWPPPNQRDKESLTGWEPEIELRSPWYDGECERRRPREIRQELDIDYIGSGNPVFDGKSARSLAYYRKLKREPEAWVNVTSGEEIPQPRDPEGYLVVWQRWEKDKTYIVGADPVEGKEDGDFATVKVYCREDGDVAASYYSQIDEIALADIIELIAKRYSDEGAREFPWVAPETNSCGLATFDKLLEKGIRNLFMMPKYETTKAVVTYRKGWVTGAGSRRMLVAGIREALNERRGFIDPRCVGELGTFVHNKVGKPIAKSGCHDDEVMCFGICLQVDEIAPWVSKAYPKRARIGAEGIRAAMFAEPKKIEGEPETLEEKCLACAIAKQAERIQPKEEAFEAAIDAMFGFSDDDDFF